MMKCHAFVRENIPKAVKYDKDGGMTLYKFNKL